MTNHTNCDHPATKAARAKCRKASRSLDFEARELLAVLNEGYCPSLDHWVNYGARRFAKVEEGTATERARAILNYFAPSGDEAQDARRLANGYIITTDHREIRRIILRAAS